MRDFGGFDKFSKTAERDTSHKEVSLSAIFVLKDAAVNPISFRQ